MAFQKRLTFKGTALQSAAVGDRLFFTTLLDNNIYIYTQISNLDSSGEAPLTISDLKPLVGIPDDSQGEKFGGMLIEYDNIFEEWYIMMAYDGALFNTIWDSTFTAIQDTVLLLRDNCWNPRMFKESVYNTSLIVFNPFKDSNRVFGMVTEDFRAMDCARLDVYLQTDEYTLNGEITLPQYERLLQYSV